MSHLKDTPQEADNLIFDLRGALLLVGQRAREPTRGNVPENVQQATMSLHTAVSFGNLLR